MSKLFVKRLTNLDFSFLDAKRGLVGESWLMDIELSGMLNEQGMVLDFGIVKRLVRDYIDNNIDHCLLVPTRYEGCDVLDLGEQVEIAFYLHNGQSITYRSTHNAVTRIPAEVITTETVKSFILKQLQALLPENISALDIRLYTQTGLRDNYQYSHGLRKHQGNCQRIAHGHRSELQIEIDGEPSLKWEQYWIQKWQDIYLGTRAHLVDNKFSETSYHHFNYQTTQGDFFLKLPRKSCYLIDNESTVENLAQHLAEQIAAEEPGKKIKVRAFEGIDKGAIAEVS